MFLLFASCLSAVCHCSISSCKTDSALSVSVSCNISVATLTLSEAILQHFCSSTLCLQHCRGSTVFSRFRQKLLWRHNVTFLSRSSLSISSLSLPSHSLVLNNFFTAVVTAFRCVTKSRLKALLQCPVGTHCTLCCALTYAFWHIHITRPSCWL